MVLYLLPSKMSKRAVGLCHLVCLYALPDRRSLKESSSEVSGIGKECCVYENRRQQISGDKGKKAKSRRPKEGQTGTKTWFWEASMISVARLSPMERPLRPRAALMIHFMASDVLRFSDSGVGTLKAGTGECCCY